MSLPMDEAVWMRAQLFLSRDRDICSESDLTRYSLRSIPVLPVNWPQVTRCPNVTYIVDSYKTAFADITAAPNWLAEFGPKLVRTANDGEFCINTPVSHVLGTPTVMVAGMTPTTANEQFAAAINSAGYHVELGGGIYTESDLESKIGNLAKLLMPGQGITLNCIYTNQHMWSFRFSAMLRLRAKGVPIEFLLLKTLTIIDSLRSTDIRHIVFKPSTAEAIRHFASTVKAHNEFPAVLQWTGGRAGGHHLFEDFHQPILETYALVCACRNIVLVAGPGFGDVKGSLPYLTGNWSVVFGRAPMTFDSILLGSRVMAAKEAGTSRAAKELIVTAPGLSNAEWHRTYEGPNGGVTTVTSEYGELNHVIITRAITLVTDLTSSVLSQPREKHTALLLTRKDKIIARLNSDYFRPWFGHKADGRVVDLEDMTYSEVISRLVELIYVKHQQRWIHESYHRLTFDSVARDECRLYTDLPEMLITPEPQSTSPTGFAESFMARYAATKSQLLHSEEIQFFVGICKRHGQKPVPFIPVLDSDLSVLFSKDNTWHTVEPMSQH
ncbi:fatty acid synthase alpha subunit Lsd1 [Coemansia sp. BCRC 34301]|nr:fatty acid synthase alpha subunit Lsd1 [Coemansia sp. BCRC 34301]